MVVWCGRGLEDGGCVNRWQAGGKISPRSALVIYAGADWRFNRGREDS